MNDTVTSIGTRSPVSSRGFAKQLVTLTRRPSIRLVLVVALYLGFACYLTWPLVTHLAHSIYGVGPGDPYGTIAFYRALVAHHDNPFLPGTIGQFAAPEGQSIPWPRDLASLPGILVLYLLATLFGAIPAYGLYTLLGYTLTGVATYLFARRLTANTWASLIAGWAFAFYPFAALNGQGHLDFVHGWVLVLAVWRLVELQWHPTRRNGLLAGLAVVLGMWWSPYFILFAGVAYVVMTTAALLIAWLDGSIRAALVPQLITALIVFGFLVFLGALSTVGAGEGTGVRTHSLGELEAYGAHLLEYLLPDGQSPLFGSVTRHYLNSLRPTGVSAVESTLYVGITVILLALAALAACVRRRLTPRLGSAVLTLWLVAVAAVITSMPPEPRIFGIEVPFPSYFISLATTTWRVYERFVMIVMLALSVLAAVGLEVLTRGRASSVKTGVMLLATVAVPLDLWALQVGHVEKISTPGIYKTLARQPTGLVAEYPLSPAGSNLYKDTFFLGAYNKPILNGYTESSFQELRALALADLAAPKTAAWLAALGVRYVLLDSAPSSWAGWPSPGKPGPGFRRIAREPHATLYAVTARPESPALAEPGGGFAPIEPAVTGPVTWLEQPSGTIELSGICTTCRGVLSMTLVSFAQPRQVTFSDSHGNVLGRALVAGSLRLSIPLQFTRHTVVRLTTTPGPQPDKQAEGSPVSLRMSDLEFAGVDRVGHHSLPINPSNGTAE